MGVLVCLRIILCSSKFAIMAGVRVEIRCELFSYAFVVLIFLLLWLGV